MEYITVAEASKLCEKTPRYLQKLCKEGKIEGARQRDNGRWEIPAESVPHCAVRGAAPPERRRVLPAGMSDFARTVRDFFYIDKTSLLQTWMEEGAPVTLFAQPAGFGKTMNMDMLRRYLELSEGSGEDLFAEKKIRRTDREYRAYQGAYPVIFLSFKSVRFPAWGDCLDKLRMVIAQEYQRHRELEQSGRLSRYEKRYFEAAAQGDLSVAELSSAAFRLSMMLREQYERPVVIMIDAYDAPALQGYRCGFETEALPFLGAFFSETFKDNPHMAYGFLAGEIPACGESGLEGLYHIRSFPVWEEPFAEFFGFTQEEVERIAMYCGHPDKLEQVREWYGGFLSGRTELYHPWSVINYFASGAEPGVYRQRAEADVFLSRILGKASAQEAARLEALLQGGELETELETDVVCRLLLEAGYVTQTERREGKDGSRRCWIRIPNREAEILYRREVLTKLKRTDTAVSQH
ncbi:MAG: AAA family ATPase [Eubacteriales bacterium]|nr:AAA family ATPase [Eubacteriales bacterium]